MRKSRLSLDVGEEFMVVQVVVVGVVDVVVDVAWIKSK